jgi:hypothetical protein
MYYIEAMSGGSKGMSKGTKYDALSDFKYLWANRSLCSEILMESIGRRSFKSHKFQEVKIMKL